MHLTWTKDLSEQLREQWNVLVLQMEKPEVFYTWEWTAAVTRAFQGGVEPWIATAYEGDELIGVAALAKPSATEAVFLAGNTADYCDFISLPGRRKEFVGEVLQALKQSGTQTVVLANLPAESATVAALKSNQSFKNGSEHVAATGSVAIRRYQTQAGQQRVRVGLAPVGARHNREPSNAIIANCIYVPCII